MEKGKLLGIGNPLLDLTVHGDSELLNKYHLEANNAVLANEEQKAIFNDLVENYDVQYTAGGSVQNSLRICQWLLRSPKVCVFMGSVGRDKYSLILHKAVQTDGVEVRYQYQTDIPTGTCAVIITNHDGHKRSLCANLGAAERFTLDHLLKPENYRFVENAQYYYISGFFLTSSFETAHQLGKIAASKDKMFLANLSAPFVCNFFKESLTKILTFTDVIFGNETEALAYAENTFDTVNIGEIALKLAKLPKENKNRKRIIIITQGNLPVIYVQDDKLHEIPVPQIPKEKIIDTNGAGDAFAGGFLSQLIQGKSIEKCIHCGIWAAGHVIQRSGCSFDRSVVYIEPFSNTV